jgi:hypothetical protein
MWGNLFSWGGEVLVVYEYAEEENEYEGDLDENAEGTDFSGFVSQATCESHYSNGNGDCGDNKDAVVGFESWQGTHSG